MQVSDRDLRYLRREMLREVDSMRKVSYPDAVVAILQNKEPARNRRHLQQETINSDKDTGKRDAALIFKFHFDSGRGQTRSLFLDVGQPSTM